MLGCRSFASVLVICAGVCAGTALGQTTSEGEPLETSANLSTETDELPKKQKAKQLYEEGLAAYRAGKYSDAIDKLLEADQVMPNAAFSYNIALVYEAMGDKRSALRWLRSHLRQSDDENSKKDTWIKVRKFEKELQARGLQQVTILSTPTGATVWIDGHALGITPFTTELVPGSHSVSLAHENYDPAQKAFELRADRSSDVEVVLVASKGNTVPGAIPSEVVGVPNTPLKSSFVVTGKVAPSLRSGPVFLRVQPVTWVGLGVSVVLLGGAAGFEVKRRVDEDQARSASNAAYESRYDEMESSKQIARVLLTTGAAIGAVGLTLLAFDLTRKDPVQTAILGSCSTAGICAAMRGQF